MYPAYDCLKDFWQEALNPSGISTSVSACSTLSGQQTSLNHRRTLSCDESLFCPAQTSTPTNTVSRQYE